MTRRFETSVLVDGCALSTIVHLPLTGDGPWPTILLRTPYGKPRLFAEAQVWARAGVAVAVQDVRGRYESEGEFAPYQDEEHDGGVVFDWIVNQEWSDGRIVASGSSYGAHCAISVAAVRPVSAVVAVAPALGLATTGRERSDVPRLYSHVAWWTTFGDCRTDRGALVDVILSQDPDVLDHLPVSDLPDRLGIDAPRWLEPWTARRTSSVEEAVAALGNTPPLLAISGLHDLFFADAISVWEHWPGPSRLLVGPWGHELRPIEGDDMAKAGPAGELRAGSVLTAFVMAALKDNLALGRRAVVSTSDGRWHHGSEHWPSPLARSVRLGSNDAPPAAGSSPSYWPGPLRLTGATPSFVADPAQPFPSRLGPCDVSGDQDRNDAIRFTGAAATSPVLVTGSITAGLDVTEEIGSDWLVRVSDAEPNGTVRQLGHGISHHDGSGTVTVTTSPICHVFETGSQLQVEIAGHHHPLHVRDLHTGDRLRATAMQPVTKTLAIGTSRLLIHAEPAHFAPESGHPREVLAT